MANEEKKRSARVIEALMNKRGDDDKSDLDNVHVDRLLHILRSQGGEHGAHLASVLGEPAEGFQPTHDDAPDERPRGDNSGDDTRIG